MISSVGGYFSKFGVKTEFDFIGFYIRFGERFAAYQDGVLFITDWALHI